VTGSYPIYPSGEEIGLHGLLTLPLDFCVWGVLKSKVYTPKPMTMVEVRNNITREVAQLDPAMLVRAILDVKKLCQKCIAANGGYLE
jgi:hypothetical protein